MKHGHFALVALLDLTSRVVEKSPAGKVQCGALFDE
jgi:hypothetical protein